MYKYKKGDALILHPDQTKKEGDPPLRHGRVYTVTHVERGRLYLDGSPLHWDSEYFIPHIKRTIKTTVIKI
jgi:hypothetical protein